MRTRHRGSCLRETHQPTLFPRYNHVSTTVSGFSDTLSMPCSITGRHLRVADAQLAFERLRQQRRPEPRPDLAAGGRERPYVGDVEVGEPFPDAAGELLAGEEFPERVRGGGVSGVFRCAGRTHRVHLTY